MKNPSWIGWYWVKWSIVVLTKGSFELAIIIAGPIMLLLNVIGLVSISDQMKGIGILCLVFALPSLFDFIDTIMVPWSGGNKSTVYLEYWDTWKTHKEWSIRDKEFIEFKKSANANQNC